MCVCNVSYAAFNAHVPYCHLWPFRLYQVLPHYFTQARFLEKKISVQRIVFLVYNFCLKHFLF